MPKQGEATLEFEAVNQAQGAVDAAAHRDQRRRIPRVLPHITHDGEAPLAWSHNRVEGKREYTSLLYIPARAPFDLWQRDAARGLKLHVKRVFIMDDAEQFLPLYLRFIKGVLDSSDLPLNVSRELLQKDPEVEAMRSALTKRALDMLGEARQGRTREIRAVLEGVRRGAEGGRGRGLRPTARSCCRCCASPAPTSRATTDKMALADYVARMQPGPGEDLLRAGRKPRRRTQQPVHRAAARAQGRGAAAGRPGRPLDHGPAARVRRQELPGCRARRSGPRSSAMPPARPRRRRRRRAEPEALLRARCRRCWAMRWPA